MDQRSSDSINVYIDGRQSIWQSCPLIYQTLNALLGRAYEANISFPNLLSILPFISYRNQVRYALTQDKPFLDPNRNDQPDVEHGQAFLQETASQVLGILRQLQLSMSIRVRSIQCLSHTDRQFLQLLLHPNTDGLILFVCEKKAPLDRNKLLLAYSRYLQGGNGNRLLGVILRGVDRALSCALYKEASLRIRLAVRLYNRYGELPAELMERLGFVYMALGSNKRAAQCQLWLADQAKQPLAQCYALISFAAQLVSHQKTTEALVQARQSLDRVRKLEVMIVEEERWLVQSMRMNTLSLVFFLGQHSKLALFSLARSYHVLVKKGLLKRFSSQAAIVCDNAVRVALGAGDHDKASVWADRMLQLELTESHILMRCSKVFAKLEMWEFALSYANRARDAGFPLGRICLYRAIFFHKAGDYLRVLEELEESERLMGRNVQICLLRASAHEESSNLDHAQLHYELALTMDADNVYILADYARILWLKGQEEQSKDTLLKAIQLAPDNQELFELKNRIFG